MERDEFSFKPLREISENQLRQIWNSQFSDKPFPKMKAFILADSEFIRVHKRLLESPCIHDTQIQEYGDTVPSEMFSAFVTITTEGLLIFVRNNSTNTLDEDLEHELKHIYLEHHKKW